MSEHEQFMEHIFKTGIHWPRKELSGKPGTKGPLPQSKSWFGNSPKAHPTPITIGRSRKKRG